MPKAAAPIPNEPSAESALIVLQKAIQVVPPSAVSVDKMWISKETDGWEWGLHYSVALCSGIPVTPMDAAARQEAQLAAVMAYRKAIEQEGVSK